MITDLILGNGINAALCGFLGLGSTLIGLVILQHSTSTAAATTAENPGQPEGCELIAALVGTQRFSD